MKDHLGSVHAVVDASNNVVSAQDYDAWGCIMPERQWVQTTDQSIYKFTSKERDNESNYDYFGARYYDSRIGRWGSLEPLQDKYPGSTPYGYVFDNPIQLFDANGKGPKDEYLETPEDVGGGPEELGPLGDTRIGGQRVTPPETINETQSETINETEAIKVSEVESEQGAKSIEGKTSTVENVSQATVNEDYPLPKLATQLEKQYEENGPESLYKSINSFKNLIKEHTEKLKTAKYTSSLEREIETFQKSVETIVKFIKNKVKTQ